MSRPSNGAVERLALREARRYYAGLSDRYDVKIRQLVPRYDEMIDALLTRLERAQPASVLDLGAGDGSLTGRVLSRLPHAHVVAVERSEEMAARAAAALSAFGTRATLRQTDLRDLDPGGERFDAVYSNLVLHNLGSAAKAALLRRTAGWLADRGVMLWGDLIRHDDRWLQEQYVAERMAFARVAGCSEELISENFAKEARVDDPWTVDRMVRACRDAGFTDPECVWRHDTFAVIAAGGRHP